MRRAVPPHPSLGGHYGWFIETSFQELTDLLRCAVDTLAYPRAALFGFALALVAFSLLAVLKGALANVQGQAVVAEELSSYYVAQEVSSPDAGMQRLMPAALGEPGGRRTPAALAGWRGQVTRQIPWKKYKKSRRGPRKPSTVQRTRRGAHRSTARVLQNRQNK